MFGFSGVSSRRGIARCASLLVLCFVAVLASAEARGPARASFYFKNLVVNGGAEDGIASPDLQHVVKPYGWTTSPNFTIVQYGGPGDLPPPGNSTGPFQTATGGVNFFAGGPSSNVSAAWQNVDLRRARNDIDGRGRYHGRRVKFIVSALLGGRLAAPDYGLIYVRFFGDIRNPDGTRRCGSPGVPCFVLGPVTRAVRASKSILLPTSCWGEIPPGSGWLQISMLAKRISGYDNDAFFDNVVFRLITPSTRIRREVAPCLTNPDQATDEANVYSTDARTSGCQWWTFSGVKLAVMFFVGSLVFGFLRNPPPSARTLLERAGLANGRAADVVVYSATAVALAAAFFGTQTLLHYEAVFHAGDTGCVIDQSWAVPAIGCAVLVGYAASGVFYLFLHALHGTAIWKMWVLFTDAFLFSFVVALGLIGQLSPQIDELMALDVGLLFIAVAITFMLLAIRLEIRDFHGALRWGLFALVVALAWQPSIAMWNIRQIKHDRIAAENQRRSLGASGYARNGAAMQFDNVLFYAPTSLDYGESARVRFTAHVSNGRHMKPCVVPRIVAPGFMLHDVLAEPVRISSEARIQWEWIATPLHSGRQRAFLEVLASPTCRGLPKGVDVQPDFSAASAASREGTAPPAASGTRRLLFTETESVWVSRQTFALDDFSGALPWLSVLLALIPAVVSIIDARGRRVKPPDEAPSRVLNAHGRPYTRDAP